MVKGKLGPAVALLDEIVGAAPGFADPVAFGNVIWREWLVSDADAGSEGGCAYIWARFEKTRVNAKRQAGMLEFLTMAELAVGNLVEAKRLAGENFVNSAFRGRIAFYEGDWKATPAKHAPTVSRLGKTAHSKWNQVNTLSYVVELRRVIGDYDGAAVST